MRYSISAVALLALVLPVSSGLAIGQQSTSDRIAECKADPYKCDKTPDDLLSREELQICADRFEEFHEGREEVAELRESVAKLGTQKDYHRDRSRDESLPVHERRQHNERAIEIIDKMIGQLTEVKEHPSTLALLYVQQNCLNPKFRRGDKVAVCAGREEIGMCTTGG